MTDTDTLELPPAWIPRAKRIDHPERRRMRLSPARFKWCAAARRSGKSTDGIDYLLLGHGPMDAAGQPWHRGALCPPERLVDPTFVAAAPTREMVKRIWWGRIKERLPSYWVDKISESELTVYLANGAKIICMGMDRPTRGEGIAIDGLVGDEFAYWKLNAYERSLEPALSTRGRKPGWAILMGKPAGRNHFFDSWTKAKEGLRKDHDAFHWVSAEVLRPEEIEAKRASMDPRSFAQEYEASFLSQTGLVYYQWDGAANMQPVAYDPGLPLVFCFDFNVSPGAAVVCQEQFLPGPDGKPVQTTCVLRQYYKQDDNNAPEMCNVLASYYPEHKQSVLVYGDSSGNQRRTSAASTDWEIVRTELTKFYGDVRIRVPRRAPDIIDSVNALNARIRSSDGTVRLVVNTRDTEEIRKDFEGVVWDEKRGDREIDKRNRLRTHWTDALRYYVAETFPVGGNVLVTY